MDFAEAHPQHIVRSLSEKIEKMKPILFLVILITGNLCYSQSSQFYQNLVDSIKNIDVDELFSENELENNNFDTIRGRLFEQLSFEKKRFLEPCEASQFEKELTNSLLSKIELVNTDSSFSLIVFSRREVITNPPKEIIIPVSGRLVVAYFDNYMVISKTDSNGKIKFPGIIKPNAIEFFILKNQYSQMFEIKDSQTNKIILSYSNKELIEILENERRFIESIEQQMLEIQEGRISREKERERNILDDNKDEKKFR